MSRASECSDWNFKNKTSLLKAEQFSLSSDDQQAAKEYGTAIKAAQASRFIHEEGLAAELAAMHHQRLGNNTTALSLFSQARECYKRWGSNAKVRQVTEKISQVQIRASKNNNYVVSNCFVFHQGQLSDNNFLLQG